MEQEIPVPACYFSSPSFLVVLRISDASWTMNYFCFFFSRFLVVTFFIMAFIRYFFSIRFLLAGCMLVQLNFTRN